MSSWEESREESQGQTQVQVEGLYLCSGLERLRIPQSWLIWPGKRKSGLGLPVETAASAKTMMMMMMMVVVVVMVVMVVMVMMMIAMMMKISELCIQILGSGLQTLGCHSVRFEQGLSAA